MRIACSVELGCMLFDGVPFGMPGQPLAVEERPSARRSASVERNLAGSADDGLGMTSQFD